MGTAAAIAGICCVLITIGIIFTQCIVRRRKRKKEAKAQKELAELEGIELEGSSDAIDDQDNTDDNVTKDADMKKKKKKGTKEKRKEALKEKAENAQGSK